MTAADQDAAERVRLLLDTYRSYLTGLAELRVADPDELIAPLESWVTSEGMNPAAATIDDATRMAGASSANGPGRSTASGPGTSRGPAS